MTATKDNIIVLPHQDLRKRSARIGIITEATHNLIKDMESAVHDWDASRKHEVTVALAAVQIDELYRVVIVRDNFEHESPATYTALINPEITKCEGGIKRDFEGCLSIRSVYGMVPRYERVRIRALNERGKEVKIKASGFLARVLQHEIDHTNGKVFIDRIKGDKEAFYKLNDEGKLVPLDYDKEIRGNPVLWGKAT